MPVTETPLPLNRQVVWMAPPALRFNEEPWMVKQVLPTIKTHRRRTLMQTPTPDVELPTTVLQPPPVPFP